MRTGHQTSAKRYFVPATRGFSIFSVRFVFKHQKSLSDISILINNQVSDSNVWIEVHITYRQRFFQYIPNRLLRKLKKQISVERQFAFGQTLDHADLKFHIRVICFNLLTDRDATDKIIILKHPEIRAIFNHRTHTVGIIIRSCRLDPLPEDRSETVDTAQRALPSRRLLRIERTIT